MNKLSIVTSPNTQDTDSSQNAELQGKLTIALAAAIIQGNAPMLLSLSQVLTDNFAENEIQRMWSKIKKVIKPQELQWLACVLTQDPDSCPLVA